MVHIAVLYFLVIWAWKSSAGWGLHPYLGVQITNGALGVQIEQIIPTKNTFQAAKKVHFLGFLEYPKMRTTWFSQISENEDYMPSSSLSAQCSHHIHKFPIMRTTYCTYCPHFRKSATFIHRSSKYMYLRAKYAKYKMATTKFSIWRHIVCEICPYPYFFDEILG